MSTEKYPWPQWQLTAFVLDELTPDIAAQIQATADKDPSLADEITAIRATVAQVKGLFESEAQAIEPTSFNPASTRPAANTIEHPSNRKVNWVALAGLLAMAASLLVAVVFALPALTSYRSSPNDVLALDSSFSMYPSGGPQELVLAADGKKDANENKLSDVVESLAQASSAPQSTAPTPLSTLDESVADAPVPVDAFAAKEWEAVEGGSNPPNLAWNRGGVAGGMGGRAGGMDGMAGGKDGMAGGMDGRMAGMGYGGGGYGGMAGGVSGMGGGMMGGESGEGGAMGRAMLPAKPARMSVANGNPAGDGVFFGTEVVDGERLEDGLGMNVHPLPGREETVGKEQKKRYRSSTGEMGARDRFAPIYENPFKQVESDPLTTFSIDVDTASYVKTRQFLMQSHSLPPANAVRVEEFINYFEYEYAGPQGDDPFAANLAVATCPWRTDHKLVRIALQAKKLDFSERPKANIVFLLDVSGSMDEPNKLPLVKESMRMLIQQLGENDRVAMVVYAGAAGCVLESTTGDKQEIILGALDRLNAGGSTNGGQGIQLAYDIARDHFVPGGVNRVILCTDGDFNVGTTSTEGLVNLVVENAKSRVFLTVLGFGMGNTNDVMMEQISDKGNGVYAFVDSRREAQRQMIKQLAGNLMTVAKDVKIQVEFNPERVASYRLIGYENRKLANEDFANDKKDAGEIGAGHRVTALYEIEPIGAAKVQPAEGLRYQKRKAESVAVPAEKPKDEPSNELLAVNLRYKQPEGDTSKLLTFPLVDSDKPFHEADQDFKWAASVAQFAMLLRNSSHKGNATWSGLLETADSLASDESRRECISMIRTAAGLSAR